eukprot:TRINITY_DN12940_c0_g1_i3.p1 TRINITY_DN12940_c0_g1~~TRINITY_DN12940_c0_g1_i3.p1  ORF type:complete len:324 (+),score=38.20 TRINITY_DN12940_c0_g1_i3:97-972(+)
MKSEATVVYVQQKRQPRMVAVRPRRLCILILIALVVVLGAYATIAAYGVINGGLQDEIDRFGKENDRLEEIEKEFRAQNVILAEQIDELNVTRTQLGDEVDNFQSQNVRYASALNSLNGTIDDLNDKLDRLNTLQASLSDQLSSTNESNAQLSESLDQLQVAKERLQGQLTEFNGLRTSISQYSQTTNNNFDTVLQATLGLFRNVSQLTEENTKVNLFQIANSNEFLQGNTLGFSTTEYDRFLDQVASLLEKSKSELASQYPFSPSANSPNMTFTQVADTIDQLATLYVVQ